MRSNSKTTLFLLPQSSCNLDFSPNSIPAQITRSFPPEIKTLRGSPWGARPTNPVLIPIRMRGPDGQDCGTAKEIAFSEPVPSA